MASFFAYRLYAYKKDEPLRQVVSLLKEEQFTKAFAATKKLSDERNKDAEIILGRLYAFGLGIDMDRELAIEILACKSTDHCIPGKEEFSVGLDFINGYGGVIDKDEALFWIKKSSQQGYSQASEWLQKNKIED